MPQGLSGGAAPEAPLRLPPVQAYNAAGAAPARKCALSAGGGRPEDDAMTPDQLKILATPEVRGCRMVLGYSGWHGRREVSTGDDRLSHRQAARQPVAEIDGDDFYIFSFPGSMENLRPLPPARQDRDGLITE